VKEMGTVKLITVLDGRAAINPALKGDSTHMKIGSLKLKQFIINEFLWGSISCRKAKKINAKNQIQLIQT
jgi:hypothetical protein